MGIHAGLGMAQSNRYRRKVCTLRIYLKCLRLVKTPRFRDEDKSMLKFPLYNKQEGHLRDWHLHFTPWSLRLHFHRCALLVVEHGVKLVVDEPHAGKK